MASMKIFFCDEMTRKNLNISLDLVNFDIQKYSIFASRDVCWLNYKLWCCGSLFNSFIYPSICADVCYDVVRICPPSLQFFCPDVTITYSFGPDYSSNASICNPVNNLPGTLPFSQSCNQSYIVDNPDYVRINGKFKTRSTLRTTSSSAFKHNLFIPYLTFLICIIVIVLF